MDRNPSDQERRLDQLESALGRVEARLSALEEGRPIEDPQLDPADEKPDLAETSTALRSSLGLGIADFGRGFLIMAGAFMLRALSNSEVLPLRLGIGLGLLYAVFWIAMAGRSGDRGRTNLASLYGTLAALVAYPLLWEAPTRFAALSPALAALLISLVTAFALFTAWRKGLRLLAWIFTLSALVTSISLLFATKVMAPYIGIILLLGLATIWMGYTLKWHGLRWAPALSGDALVLFMVSITAREKGIPESWNALNVGTAEFLAVSLLLVYLGSFVVRTLVRRRDVTHFEVLQSAAALFIGFGGAARMAVASGSGGLSLGIAALAAAAACYVLSFVFVDRRLGRGRNFFFFTSLAIVLNFLGCLLVLDAPALALAWCLMALVAAYLGGRYDRITLRMHSAIYALAAFYFAGGLVQALRAFWGPVEEAIPPAEATTYLVLLAAVATYALLVSTQRKLSSSELERLPRFLILTISVFGIAGLAVSLSIQGTVAWPLGEALRVAILSVSAVALAMVGRRRLTLEFSWLAYPVIVLGGLKLLMVVLRGGEAVTLFLGFAFYGAALILTPRFLRAAKWRAEAAATGA